MNPFRLLTEFTGFFNWPIRIETQEIQWKVSDKSTTKQKYRCPNVVRFAGMFKLIAIFQYKFCDYETDYSTSYNCVFFGKYGIRLRSLNKKKCVTLMWKMGGNVQSWYRYANDDQEIGGPNRKKEHFLVYRKVVEYNVKYGCSYHYMTRWTTRSRFTRNRKLFERRQCINIRVFQTPPVRSLTESLKKIRSLEVNQNSTLINQPLPGWLYLQQPLQNLICPFI